MRAFHPALIVLTLGTLSQEASAQTGTYVPSQVWPGVVQAKDGVAYVPTKEVVLLFISSSWAPGAEVTGFHRKIAAAKDRLSARVDSLGYSFNAIGLSVDDDLRVGIDYLLSGVTAFGAESLGPWAEIVVGRNWLSAASSLYVLETPSASLSVPQILIVQRTVKPAFESVEVGPPQLIYQVAGSGAIQEWIERGCPLGLPR